MLKNKTKKADSIGKTVSSKQDFWIRVKATNAVKQPGGGYSCNIYVTTMINSKPAFEALELQRDVLGHFTVTHL